jgi:hypothetical protein
MVEEKIAYELVKTNPDGTLLLKPTGEKLAAEEIKAAPEEFVRSCTLCRKVGEELKCEADAIQYAFKKGQVGPHKMYIKPF